MAMCTNGGVLCWGLGFRSEVQEDNLLAEGVGVGGSG